MKSDIEIARLAKKVSIHEVGAKLGIPSSELVCYGSDKAKVNLSYLDSLQDKPNGKLILVTAISPTPAGEGKTTTSIGLSDALNRIGAKTTVCLREPSLGPCFGLKGGAAGGGYSQVIPMEDINLHFTGDLHAIGSANNLLSAMIDNYIHWSNDIRVDLRRVTWRRAVDISDRSLREVITGVGGPTNGYPMEAGFNLTVASEVMAAFCLTDNLLDLQTKLGNMLIGYTRNDKPVVASQIQANGAMAALLKDALAPNLVQTLENNPAFIHGGPFANIAHGCNSVIATKAALKMSDYVVTEAGFGSDLGAEKFFNIKCRKSGLTPDVAVIVATVKALKMHGGVSRDKLKEPNLAAVEKGLANLGRHIQSTGQFGVPMVVAINQHDSDQSEEIDIIKAFTKELGVDSFTCSNWKNGSAGAVELAQAVKELADAGHSQFRYLYPDNMSLWEKTRTIARSIYGADDINADKAIRDKFKLYQEQGYGHYPICMAKTPFSFSTDPKLMGAPSNHRIKIRDLVLATGAEFLIVVCGDIMRMPGLPRTPAANSIYVNKEGQIEGLF